MIIVEYIWCKLTKQKTDFSCEKGSRCGSEKCKRKIYVNPNGSFGVEHQFTCGFTENFIKKITFKIKRITE